MSVAAGDEGLRDELVAGCEQAYALLYDRCAARLFKVAWALTGNREEAEDAVQDVFTAMVQTRETLRRVESLEAYLFASVHRAAIRRAVRSRSRSQRESAVGQELFQVSEKPVESPYSDRLECALHALPLDQREIVTLKVDAGLTFDQIASALNLSANTAASRYRYALEKLRSALKGQKEGSNV